MKKSILCCLIFVIAFASCESREKTFEKSPVNTLIEQNMAHKSFSIVLYDMKIDEEKSIYKHKYQVSTNLQDTLQYRLPNITEWYDVEKDFFADNVDNLGMELAAKSPDGLISKIPTPLGYNSYVGNDKYGQWNQDGDGSSFWAFYGRYAFMGAMFGMISPVSRVGYNDYNSNFRGRDAYYGSKSASGTSQYGTNSEFSKRSNPVFYKMRSKSVSSFSSKVSRRAYSSTSRSSSSSRTKSPSFGSRPGRRR